MGLDNAKETVAGVHFSASTPDIYRVCLWSRLANRILLPIGSIYVSDADALYEGVKSLPWEEHLALEGSLTVDFTGTNTHIRNTQFGAQRTKDGVVDRLRDGRGRRPSVDRRRPDVRINVYLYRDQATISIDLSGDSLHRRGYRLSGGAAPLKENLAAGLLIRAGWPEIAKRGGALVDPMCGSGTFLAEGLMMAMDIAPGLARSRWGFSGWLGHIPAAWSPVREEAVERARVGRSGTVPPVFGYDASGKAAGEARDTLETLGFADYAYIRRRELAELVQPNHQRLEPGLVIANPPYGERLGDEHALSHLYRFLGERLQREFVGWRAAIFTGNPMLGKQMAMRPTRRYKLFNGPIAAQLLLFEVGSAADSGRDFSEAPVRAGAHAVEDTSANPPAGDSVAVGDMASPQEKGAEAPHAQRVAAPQRAPILSKPKDSLPTNPATDTVVSVPVPVSGRELQSASPGPASIPDKDTDADRGAVESSKADHSGAHKIGANRVELREVEAATSAHEVAKIHGVSNSSGMGDDTSSDDAKRDARKPNAFQDGGAGRSSTNAARDETRYKAPLLSDSARMFANRLKKNLRHLGRWARKSGISAYRVYDADIPEYSVAIDIYGEWVHVAEYRAPSEIDEKIAEQRLRDVLAVIPTVLEVTPERVVLKQRMRQRGTQQYQRHASEGEFLEISEGNVKLLVNLKDYLDTGLFLDHRPTRLDLAARSKGKRFANLFCYTASATVHAAVAGASYTVSVDTSATYISWAQRNLALNGLAQSRHELVREDCRVWLEECEDEFDVILLDPPTFSNSTGSDSFDVQRDHSDLIDSALRLLSDDGLLIFSTNRRGFSLDAYFPENFLVEDRTNRSVDEDFRRGRRPHQCWYIYNTAPD
jgi:23S rRNA G2445 N2-methylase RlmL/23S rRNA G2069 N7-methylase RlmK/C1962 C5-methylase RlmI